MSLQDLLAQLQKEYLASLSEKTANLDHLWKSERLEELTTEYHKMKGTGRTYGLPEITQLGEVLEAICEHYIGLGEPPALTDALARAVPLSIKLLERIHASRTAAGEEYELDSDGDFLLLLALLPKKKTGLKKASQS